MTLLGYFSNPSQPAHSSTHAQIGVFFLEVGAWSGAKGSLHTGLLIALRGRSMVVRCSLIRKREGFISGAAGSAPYWPPHIGHVHDPLYPVQVVAMGVAGCGEAGRCRGLGYSADQGLSGLRFGQLVRG
jgi:hypothetical protein